VVSASSTSNDGGAGILNGLAQTLLDDYAFTSRSGTHSINFGDRGRVADDYGVAQTVDSNFDPAGKVFQYMGVGGPVALGSQDYSDFALWKELDQTNIIPSGLNVTGSDSVGIGGLVVRNDVRSEVDSYITDATVAASDSDITVEATEQAVINATAESAASSSGGSAYGTGTSLAINGLIATNAVLSSSSARVTDSTVTATDLTGGNVNAGNIFVDALNVSEIDATVLSATTSGDTAVGISLAFNTIGWQPQNLLFNTLDALLGDSVLGSETPAEVEAYIQDSTVTAGGDLAVQAHNLPLLNAFITNQAESAASALFGATGMSASGILASNLVSSATRAYIEFTGGQGDVSAGGNLTVSSSDEGGIKSSSDLASISQTTNDAGVSLLQDALANFDKYYDFTTASGEVVVGQPNYDHTSSATNATVATGEVVKVNYGYHDAVVDDHNTSDGPQHQ